MFDIAERIRPASLLVTLLDSVQSRRLELSGRADCSLFIFEADSEVSDADRCKSLRRERDSVG